MVDWTENTLNHKYWVMVALLQALNTSSFSFCETEYGGREGQYVNDVGVYAQGLSSSDGKVLVLINTRSIEVTISVTGASGKRASVIDERVENEAAWEVKLATDEVRLLPFATIFVHW